MLNDREMRYRIASCRAAGVPIVNYGIAIAEMHGILRRSLAPFLKHLPHSKKAFNPDSICELFARGQMR